MWVKKELGRSKKAKNQRNSMWQRPKAGITSNFNAVEKWLLFLEFWAQAEIGEREEKERERPELWVV